MSEELKTISAFYEGQDAPPPPLPQLTSQTDVSYYARRPARLLAQESIELTPPKPATLRKQRVYPGRSGSWSEADIYSPLPPRVRFREPTPNASFSSENSRSDGCDDKMDKPVGEPGRPNSGGYSLGPAVLGWSKNDFTQLKVWSSHWPILFSNSLPRHTCINLSQSIWTKAKVTHIRTGKTWILSAKL